MDPGKHLLVQKQRHDIGRRHLLSPRAAGPCPWLCDELTYSLRYILCSTHDHIAQDPFCPSHLHAVRHKLHGLRGDHPHNKASPVCREMHLGPAFLVVREDVAGEDLAHERLQHKVRLQAVVGEGVGAQQSAFPVPGTRRADVAS